MTLEIRNLKVEFPSRRGTLTALDGISLSIARGEVLGVVGESGAGKSLTGLSIIGLLEPPGRIASGEIWLEGKRIDRLPPEEMRRVRGRRIGVVFQDPLTSLNPLYTIGQQLEETILTHLPLGKAAARQRALSLLREVGIPAPEARYDNYPHQFSGGMRQRGAIALAIAAQPVLLIADEPTTALDVSIQAQSIELLKRLARARRPVGCMPLLSLRAVSRDFDVSRPLLDRVLDGEPRRMLRAVDNVDLEVNAGETLALVGESGSGKSTVARLIVGLYAPTSGAVTFSGRLMQMIFQDPYASLNPRWRVRGIIAQPMRGLPTKKKVAPLRRPGAPPPP